jgi:RNA polymerase sigma-70 factor, ECF subfamily
MNDLNVFSSKSMLGREDRSFVYSVARRIVGSANDADDVTQDAMLLAFRHRDSFRGEAKYRTWLYRIAATAALSFLRRRRRSIEQLNEGGVLEAVVPDEAKSPEASVVDVDAERFVRRAIAELEPMYRDVLLCRVDASESETAARLGITVTNVKVRAFRAREQLRDRLAAVR